MPCEQSPIFILSAFIFLLASLAGLGCFIGFGYVSEQNHFKSGICTFDSCNSTTTICGTSCNHATCNTQVCVESTMNLYLTPDNKVVRNNYTVETTLYLCNLDILNHPYPCDQILGGSKVPCYYDDRNPQDTLRLYDEYDIGGGYVAGLVLLICLPEIPMALLIIGICFRHC